jgi:hypothetical protein
MSVHRMFPSRASALCNELRDIVQGKPRFEIAEIAGRHLEGPEGPPLGGGAPAFQAPARVSLTISRKGRPARCDSRLSMTATSSSRVSVVRMR